MQNSLHRKVPVGELALGRLRPQNHHCLVGPMRLHFDSTVQRHPRAFDKIKRDLRRIRLGPKLGLCFDFKQFPKDFEACVTVARFDVPFEFFQISSELFNLGGIGRKRPDFLELGIHEAHAFKFGVSLRICYRD